MDFVTQARHEKIGELLSSVYDSTERMKAFKKMPPEKSAHLDLSPRDQARFNWGRAIIDQLAPPHLGRHTGGFERECSEEIKKRLCIQSSGTAIPLDALHYRSPRPSYSVGASAPDGLSFIDMLRNASRVLSFGAQILEDLRDDVAIPRQVSDPSLTWLAPGSTATPSDSAFGQISATPKQAIVITEVSEQLMRQSSADKIIKAGLAAVTGVGFDAAVINGTGGAQPVGLFTTPGIASASGTALGYAGLVGVQKTVADNNGIVNAETLGYLTTPTIAELLKNRQRFASTDSPVWAGGLHDGQVEGVRAASTKQILPASLIYGDWSTVWLAEWEPLMLEVDRGGTRFNQGMVAIRATWLIDVIISSPSSFVKITGIT